MTTHNLIFFRPDHIGDFVLCLPATKQLVTEGWRVTMVGSAATCQLKSALPWLDDIWDGGKLTLEQLRAGQFDVAIYSWENDPLIPLAKAAGIRKRIGWLNKSSRFGDYNTRLWRPHLRSSFRPQIYQNFDLLKPLGVKANPEMNYGFDSDSFAPARPVRDFEQRDTDKRWVIFVLEAQSARPLGTRLWIDLAQQLLAKNPQLIIGLSGTEKSQTIANAIHEGLHANDATRVLNLAGHTTLPELCHWIGSAALVIGPSTGTMHIAAACGVPQVCVYVSQNIVPSRWSAWGATVTAVKDVPRCAIRCHPWDCAIATVTCENHTSAHRVYAACANLLAGKMHHSGHSLTKHLMQQSFSILCMDPSDADILHKAGYQATSAGLQSRDDIKNLLLSHKINLIVSKHIWQSLRITGANILNSNLTGLRAPVYLSPSTLLITDFESWAMDQFGLNPA